MKTIYLISCTRRKLPHKAKVRNLYQESPWFKNALGYAEKQKPDAIYVISAKHGLLTLEKEIEPYDVNLNDFSENENKKWAERVLKDLAKVADLSKDKFIILAENTYRKNLVVKLKNYEIPLDDDVAREEQIEWFLKN